MKNILIDKMNAKKEKNKITIEYKYKKDDIVWIIEDGWTQQSATIEPYKIVKLINIDKIEEKNPIITYLVKDNKTNFTIGEKDSYVFDTKKEALKEMRKRNKINPQEIKKEIKHHKEKTKEWIKVLNKLQINIIKAKKKEKYKYEQTRNN